MKKITLFLMMLLIATFGFGQTLPITFDEPSHSNFVGEGGNTFEVVMDGTNNVGQTVSGGDQFNSRVDLALETFIDMTTSNKTFTFEFYTSEAVVMTGLFQINNEEEGGFPIEMQFTTNGEIGWETITLNFDDATNGFPNQNEPVIYGQYAGLSIFTNFGDTGSSTYWFDDIAGAANGATVPEPEPESQPETAAPTPPARAAEDVFSVYSDAYTNESSSLEAFGGGSLDFFDVDGDEFIRLSGAPGANLQWFFGIPDGVDLSSFTHYHIDYYFEGEVPGEGAIFQTIIQGFDSNSEFTGNTLHNITPTETGVWLSLDIPIETFNGGTSARTNVGQMQLAMAGPAFGPTFVDNVYFHKDTTLNNRDFDMSEFSAYPNPSENLWTIDAGTGSVSGVEVYDLTGRQVLKINGNQKSKVEVDASNLNPGVYLAKVTSEGRSRSIKLIKK
jgi:hypothetical protein